MLSVLHAKFCTHVASYLCSTVWCNYDIDIYCSSRYYYILVLWAIASRGIYESSGSFFIIIIFLHVIQSIVKLFMDSDIECCRC